MYDAMDFAESNAEKSGRFHTVSDDRGSVVSLFGPGGYHQSRY